VAILLGKQIKNFRKELKMSAAKLSAEAGISKSYLDYIESGMREPQPEVLAKIAAVLDIEPSVFIEIQLKEKIQLAIDKIKAEAEPKSNDGLHDVARSGSASQAINMKALEKLNQSFETLNDKDRIANIIENPDLRAIFKAGTNLSEEQLEQLRKVMESLYPDVFSN
jgi:transcriptional regulator with XRE-family HTH domain